WNNRSGRYTCQTINLATSCRSATSKRSCTGAGRLCRRGWPAPWLRVMCWSGGMAYDPPRWASYPFRGLISVCKRLTPSVTMLCLLMGSSWKPFDKRSKGSSCGRCGVGVSDIAYPGSASSASQTAGFPSLASFIHCPTRALPSSTQGRSRMAESVTFGSVERVQGNWYPYCDNHSLNTQESTMQFGLFTHLPWPEDTVPRRLIEEITEQVQYGEALGFQGAWFAEHHFSRYGLGSSSL